MALKLSIDTDYGITLPESYVKIASLNGTKELINFSVSYYKDTEARNNNKNAIKSNTFSFVPDLNSESNIFEQGYEHLKTLPEFIAAEDC